MQYGTAVNCTFAGNVVSEYGGGMYEGTAVNCTFTGNAAMDGGGKHEGTAVNCVFIGNTATQGGGAVAYGTAVNCTFIGNTAVYHGGGVYGGTALNGIFWGNKPTETYETGVSFSCFPSENAGKGNIVGNPRFADPLAGDFRLCADSPCVDAGTADGAPPTDHLGRPRPQGARVDMGACEHYPEDDAYAVAPPAVLRVNPASTAPAPDGLRWETAFSTLQEAAVRARYSTATEIWVVQGKYSAADGTEVAYLMPGTSMYGGFTGGESTRDERGTTPRATVIEGHTGQRCVSAHPGSLIDGFALKNGNGYEGAGMYYGAAVNCIFSGNCATDGAGMYKGTATDCSFTGNTALSVGGGMYQGAATRCTFTANQCGGMSGGAAANCTFSGNYGGGMNGGTAANSKFYGNYGGGANGGTATNCLFFGNHGGGMTWGTAVNCTLSGNFDGGMRSGTAISCIIYGNRPTETNDAYISYSCLTVERAGEGNITANPEFVNLAANDFRLRAASPCIDTGKSTGAPATDLLDRARPRGAGVDMGACEYQSGDDDHAVLPPDVLRVNAVSTAQTPDGLTWETAFPTLQTAADRAGFGTELWVASGTYSAAEGDQVLWMVPTMAAYGGFTGVETTRDARGVNTPSTIIDGQNTRRCVTANTANILDGFTLKNGRGDAGGGMRFGTAVNCAFYGNTATDYGGGGMDSGTAVNCTFFGNTAAEQGGGMCAGAALNCILWGNSPDETLETAVSYSCSSVQIAGDGNIVADPGFLDPWAADFRLEMGSPCLDVGTPGGAPSNDILNVVRPQGPGVDMGAFEMVQVAVPDLSGLVRTAARQLVVSAQLYVRGETEEYHPTVPGDHVIRQMPSAGLRVLSATPVDLVLSKGPQPVPVPNLAGLVQSAAAASLGDAGLVVGTVTQAYSLAVPAGSVLSQAPVAGTEVLPGTSVDMVLSRGGIVVPDLAGRMQDAASALIAEAGLVVGTVTQQYSLTDPAGTVISQSAAPGTPVLPGAAIDLVVSRGAIAVPDVLGRPQSAAAEAITGARLVVGTVTWQYSLTVPVDSVISQSVTAGTPVLSGAVVDLAVSKGGIAAPNVVGKSGDEAAALIVGAGLVIGTVTQEYSLSVPSGAVISQSIAAGTPVLPDTPIDLVVSKGGITVPNVAGLAQNAAATVLTDAGLAVGIVTQEYSPSVQVGMVMTQTPLAGTSVLPSVLVNLVVSRGIQPSVVPDVVGQQQVQAESAITGAGLVLGAVTQSHSETVAAGSVISQSPAAGTELPPGSAVSIVVSLGVATAVEGEPGEGESLTSDAARQQLAAAYATADSNGDGVLSFTEANAAVSGLTQAVFDEIDTNGDGQLSADELGIGNGSGCAGCTGAKGAFDPGGRMGNLFLMAFGALGLTLISAARRP